MSVFKIQKFTENLKRFSPLPPLGSINVSAFHVRSHELDFYISSQKRARQSPRYCLFVSNTVKKFFYFKLSPCCVCNIFPFG